LVYGDEKMKCQRCLSGEAAYHVHTDTIDMKVCAACAAEARRLGIGLPVRILALLPVVMAIKLFLFKQSVSFLKDMRDEKTNEHEHCLLTSKKGKFK
jgi:hypothetical protein